MMLNSYATYDVLYLGKRLQTYQDDFAVSELFLFSYLACLLSLYEGNSTSFWGYYYIKNDFGIPLSQDVLNATDHLQKLGELSEYKAYYRLTDLGNEKLEMLSMLSQFTKRNRFIDAACDCLLAIPLGYLRETIKNEPISISANTNDLKLLNDESNYAVELLHDQFSLLNQAFEKRYEDLFIPAVTWLKYLQLSSHEQYDR